MEESTIYLLLYIACFIGVIGASVMAHNNAPKWQAKLQIWGSIMHTIGMLILLASINSRGPESSSIFIIIGLVFIGFLLYIIGLLCYCLKTYTANKANEQLEYLNFQLNDQVEIRHSSQNKAPTPSATPQP